jgi:hypothetical protein
MAAAVRDPKEFVDGLQDILTWVDAGRAITQEQRKFLCALVAAINGDPDPVDDAEELAEWMNSDHSFARVPGGHDSSGRRLRTVRLEECVNLAMGTPTRVSVTALQCFADNDPDKLAEWLSS